MPSLVRAAAAAILCLAALTAQAESVVFEMRASDTLPTGPVYATLTATQTGDTLWFTAAPGPYFDALPGTTAVWQVWFNFRDEPVLFPTDVDPPNFIYTGFIDQRGFGTFTYEIVSGSRYQYFPLTSFSYRISRPGLRLEDFLLANERGWGAAMLILHDPAVSHPPTWGADSTRTFVVARVPVPEPSSLALFAVGLALLLARRRRAMAPRPTQAA